MIALALILAIVALSYAEEPLENDVANVEPAREHAKRQATYMM